jgi:hypothetical protein
MGLLVEKTKEKVMAAIEDLADLKGLNSTGGLRKSKKRPGPGVAKIKLTTKPSDHAPKDVKHVFKAGQR